MIKKTLAVLLLLALVVPFAVSAAGSGSSKGTWANHNTSVSTVELPGGGSVTVQHTKQSHAAEDPNHPLDNTQADCVGVFRTDAAGTVTSASGSCFVIDGNGDRTSFWWRQDESQTESCPVACGSWGYFAGDGRYAGISGTGTWVQTTLFAAGGSGTWESNYSIP